MNNYKLILLKDGKNILVSDEEIKVNDFVLTQENTHHQVDYVDAYTKINNWTKIIAGIDKYIKSCTCSESEAIYCGSKCQIKYPTLIYSEEVKQILRDKYGWVDIEDFVSSHFKDYWKKEDGTEMKGEEISAQMMTNMLCETSAYISGFKAHQSITNKMFSYDDIIKALEWGMNLGENSKFYSDKDVNDLLNILQKPIQLDVEVEMEINLNGKNGLDRARFIPKITNNSILVTKIL